MGLKILINFAISADGKTSTRAKTPAHFTSTRDLERLHEIRRKADAILVGRHTLDSDQMTMTIPGVPIEEQPWRCVISESGSFNPDHPFFQSDGGPRHLICPAKVDLSQYSAVIHRHSLVEWLKWLDHESKISTLLCEGGGNLVKQLFELDLVDTIHLTLASHSIFGGNDAPGITGLPGAYLPASRHYRLEHSEEGAPGEYFLTYQKA